jgi:hypothetical protein
MTTHRHRPRRSGSGCPRAQLPPLAAHFAAFLSSLLATFTIAHAQPVATPFPVEGPDDTACVAAAALGGWYATGDSFEDAVELRHIDTTRITTIARARIAPLVPWMTLDGGTDGVGALAFSDSGRLLFIALHDDTVPADGLPSDAILRYDTDTDQLTLFARAEISNLAFPWPHGAMTHFRGRLYVGAPGLVRVFTAGRNDATGSALPPWSVPGGTSNANMVTGLAVDRINGLLFASAGTTIYRAPFTGNGAATFVACGSLPGGVTVRSLAWSDHALTAGGTSSGGAGVGGLYALDATASSGRVCFIPTAQSRGLATWAPITYATGTTQWHDLAATADGALLIGADEDAVRIRDASDTRLTYDAWVVDEFDQHVAFVKSLITPTLAPGAPAGWVIDADVIAGSTRFHPATPDAAAWTVLTLIAADEVRNDPAAQGLVRQILQRYAGRAPDGIAPRRSADGHFTHWINPVNGQVKPGWPTEVATMSTMLIATAATRAAAYYPDDADIAASARAIVCGVTNWDSFLTFPGLQMFLKAEPTGGPDFTSASGGLHEGLLYMDLAATHGLLPADLVADAWFNRATWPSATYLTGRPISGNAPGVHLPAFIHSYPLLTLARYRENPTWHAGAPGGSHTSQSAAVRAAHAAWTDDNGPRFATVFSAGTTFPIYGGYRADSINNSPGDFAAFPSLIAQSASRPSAAMTPELVGAYAAYRAGARQTFAGGAQLLWRRSNLAPTTTLPDAGVPDVSHAALALAEALSPGFLAGVAARPDAEVSCVCDADFDQDGGVTGADVEAFFAAFESGDLGADLDRDGGVTGADVEAFFVAFEAGC